MRYAHVLSLLLVFLAEPLAAYDRVTGKPFASRSRVIAQHGMAATSQPLATQVAIDILKQGGSAVDAAIAANAVLGLVEPTGCGIGGDLFAIVWDAKTQKLYGLNASGRSPYSLTLAHFKERGFEYVPPRGALPITVPGCVDGTVYLETGFDYEAIRELTRAGHRIQVNVGDFGGYQAIRVDARNRVYYGASEARKDGHAAGY